MATTTRLRLLLTALLTTACALGGVSCVVAPPRAGSVDSVDRLSEMEGPWPGLREATTVSWDEHLIPFIDAPSDADAAYALGLVHAHLRLAQMEFYRKISQGRLAEMAGPFAGRLDEAIRAIDLDRAVDAMEAELPDDTRLWMMRYVEGLNDYQARASRRPADARMLALSYNEPWSVRDVLTMGRLATVDINWGRWLSVFNLQEEEGYDDFIARLWAFGDAGIPSFGGETPHSLNVLTDVGRSGSNAFVVSGDRSASGGALLASDPHLGLPQPNIWCIVGYRTPGGAAVGLSIPGIPFILVGRNEHIAWSGTNMQASSTVLYRLPADWEVTDTRVENVRVRWWFNRTKRLRESRFGPVITDASVLRRLDDDDIAMRWRGHEPSDEATALFRASGAFNWDDFRASFTSYAAGGQNILYADGDGNIGQLMAIEAIPAAAAASRVGIVDADDLRFAWSEGVPSDRLPAAFNPGDGFIVSANNVPRIMQPALIPQGNANDRVRRIRDLLTGDHTLTIDDLAAIQRDVYSEASHRLAQLLADQLESGEHAPSERALLTALSGWDGHYTIDSQGAVAYQYVLAALIDLLYESRYAPRIRSNIRSGAYVHDFVYEDVLALEDDTLLREALDEAAKSFDPDETWGDVHRLRVAHPLGMAPLVGGSYVFDDLPFPGSTTTVFKAAHRVQTGRLSTNFGANARFIADTGTLDDNRVVILGGQDGWMGSDRLLDQVDLWQSDQMIPLPLSREGQAARATRVLQLAPEPTPSPAGQSQSH